MVDHPLVPVGGCGLEVLAAFRHPPLGEELADRQLQFAVGVISGGPLGELSGDGFGVGS